MKIKQIVNDFIIKLNKEPKENSAYAICDGIYKGITIMFFDLDKMPEKGEYITLKIAEDGKDGMDIFKIPEVAVKEGFDKKIIRKIGKIPRKLSNVFYLEYKSRINCLKNDRKQ